MKAQTAKKRNPQDSTRRNVQASNKKFVAVREELRDLKWRVTRLEKQLRAARILVDRPVLD